MFKGELKGVLDHTMTKQTIATDIFQTKLGWVAIAASQNGITQTTLPEPTAETALQNLNPPPNQSLETLDEATRQILTQTKTLLTRYLNGEDVNLDPLPIDDTDWTPYTKRARTACRTIPRGQTRTYAWLANQASGNPKSARAAGRAMATNPVPIIIPCHRVIGSNGKLHGFAGTIGIPLKQKLLNLEKT